MMKACEVGYLHYTSLRNNMDIAMLEELLKKESADIKKKRLSENFGLIIDTETERRMNYMCNLSEVLVEKGLEQGIEQGIEKGIAQGIEQGIEAFITDKLEDGISSEIIIQKLEKRFNLTNEKAREYLDKYSGKM